MASCQTVIATQKADISSLRQSISDLTGEVRELKSTVATIQTQLQRGFVPDLSQPAKPKGGNDATSWNIIAKKHRCSRSGEGLPHVSNQPQKSAQAVGNVKPSVSVENARKIWGTMKAASSKTVVTAINTRKARGGHSNWSCIIGRMITIINQRFTAV